MQMPAALSRPVGPLPLWGWGVAGLAGFVVLAKIRGNPTANAALNPNTPYPPAPTDSTPNQTGTPIALQPGSSVFTPGGGLATAPSVSVSDLLGGQKFSDFINSLGGNYTNVQVSSGNTGASVAHSADNLAAIQMEADRLQAANQNQQQWLNYQVNAGQNAILAWAQAHGEAIQLDPTTGRIVSIGAPSQSAYYGYSRN